MSPLQFRKKRPLDRNIDHRADTSLIVIATEGEKTEKQYFETFKYRRVQVKVEATEKGKSSPAHVLERLDAYVKEFVIGDGDELWLAIDVDRWEKRMLAEVTREAVQKGFSLAVSNPCFELWLLLHF